MRERGSATARIEAPADAVYSMVSDITRMGDWSPECRTGEWAEGSSSAEPGARFRGFNQIQDFKWEVDCEIRKAEPGKLLEFVAGVGIDNATVWTYEFNPDGSATIVTESFYAPLVNVEGSPANIPGRDDALQSGCETTLAKLKAAAEA